jgi:hypothetical protein
MRGNKAKKVGELLWREVICWITKAKEGYTSEMQHGQTSRGGNCVWLNIKWAKLVSYMAPFREPYLIDNI